MRSVAAAVVFAVVLAACGGLGAADRQALARLEGRWMCDVQRFTFEDVGAIESELEARVVAAGYAVADYAEFKAILAETPDLREQVRKAYEEYCA